MEEEEQEKGILKYDSEVISLSLENITLILKTNFKSIQDKIDIKQEKQEDTNYKYKILIFTLISILILIFFPYSNSIITIKRNIDFKCPTTIDYIDVTMNELENGLNSTFTFNEGFYIMEKYLRNNNKTCISIDYFNIKNNNKKIAGLLINNKKDFLPIINPRITGHEIHNTTVKINDECHKNKTITLHKSIIVDYIYYEKYNRKNKDFIKYYIKFFNKKIDFIHNINQFEGNPSNCLEILIKKFNSSF